MTTRECYCETGSEQTCCKLRAVLSDSHQCPSLAPWERELYNLARPEPEPYVDLTVTLSDFRQVSLTHVRGISHKDGEVTCEDEQGILYFVPNVLYWQTEVCDQ